jgi:parallel beta-helix repeat protein
MKRLSSLLFLCLLFLPDLAQAKQKFSSWAQDPRGNKIGAVTVTVYAAGTTTLSTLFTGSTCATSLANPFTSDPTSGAIVFCAANGKYDIKLVKTGWTFTASDTYGITLTDPTESLSGMILASPTITGTVAGKAIYTEPAIGGYPTALLPATCTDGALVVVTDGTRGLRRCKGNQWLKESTVAVTEFGAVGDDATDNRVAFNTAILAVNSAGGGTVTVPVGTYLFTTADATDTNMTVTALCGTSNMRLTGEGDKSILKTTQNKSIIGFGAATCTTTATNLEIDHLHFLGDQPGTVSPPAKLQQGAIEMNLGTSYDTLTGLRVHDNLFEAVAQALFVGPGSTKVDFLFNRILDTPTGFQTTQAGTRPLKQLNISYNKFTISTANRIADTAVGIFFPVEDVTIVGNEVDGNSTSANTLSNAYSIFIDNRGTTADHYTKRVKIIGNIIRRTGMGAYQATQGGNPIDVASTNTTAGVVADIDVLHNTIEDALTGIGYRLSANSGVSNLRVEGNTIRTVDEDGIVFPGGTNCTGLKIIGNTIITPQRTGATGSGTAGILVGSCTNVEVTQNIITAPTANAYGIWASSITGLTIKENTIANVQNDAIITVNTGGSQLMGNVINTPGLRGINVITTGADLTNVEISHNAMTGLGTSTNTMSGIEVGDTTTDLRILSNRVSGGYDCIKLTAGTDYPRLQVEGNTCTGPGNHGINVRGTDILVSNNTVNAATDRGITSNDVITRGTLSGNVVRGSGGHGIVVAAPAANSITITGNTSTGNTGAGLFLQDATGGLIAGNILTNNGTYGLRLVPGSGTPTTNTSVVGNLFASNSTSAVEFTASLNTGIQFANNQGYSDIVYVTAGSGTGVTVNDPGSPRQQVYKVTVSYTNCIANATTCDLTIATLPAKTFLRRVFADLTQAYVCAATCTTATLSATLGTSAGGNQLLVSFDLDAAAAQFGDADGELGATMTAATRAANGALFDGVLMSWSATTTLTYRITSGTGNVGTGAATNFNAGAITFYLVTEILP